jgi:integrating conjugative element protein (TIGR03756 family)
MGCQKWMRATYLQTRRWGLFKAMALLILAVSASGAYAGGINTAEIVLKTSVAAPKCLKYKVQGVCYWTKPGLIPTVATTLKVRHYLPEAVVSVYTRKSKNPWIEMRVLESGASSVSDKLFSTLTSARIGDGSIRGANQGLDNIHLFEASVIGNPLGAGLMKYFPTLLLHKAKSEPFVPYYSSILDAISWRSPEVEVANWWRVLDPKYSISPDGHSSWGSIYPRSGFVEHWNKNKASAVLAMRAFSIATTPAWTHVHQNIESNSCGEKCTTPGEAKHDKKTLFQMIHPKTDSECHLLADEPDPEWTKEGKEQQSFSWVVWREYEGCISYPGKYIGSMNFA